LLILIDVSQTHEGDDRKREIQLSLARALHAQHTSSVLREDCEDATLGSSTDLEALQQRCVDIVMDLVARDESDWETLLL